MTRGGGVSAVDVSDELARRLRAVGRAVAPEEIGELWIFPPLSERESSAEFLLFTRRLEEGRRRVYSARAAARADGGPEDGRGPGGDGTGARVRGDGGAEDAAPRNGGPGQRITEHGSVPSGRVHRLVDRFRRRLEDGGEPLHVVIEGRRERWSSLLGGG